MITLLPDHVANQIAAGEVVQRPASAVKELLENAIDSMATDIKLIIKDSGKTLIQVIDNGSGMNEVDAKICFERHATSKISKADDLYSLTTKGFRGEALASIAAIAQVDLKTKKEVGMMKKTAFLINTSRGLIINENDLIQSLKDEIIAGVGLDVYDKEPLSQDHKLRFLPNALILPHIGYVTAENYSTFYTQMLENLDSCIKHKPLRLIS